MVMVMVMGFLKPALEQVLLLEAVVPWVVPLLEVVLWVAPL